MLTLPSDISFTADMGNCSTKRASISKQILKDFTKDVIRKLLCHLYRNSQSFCIDGVAGAVTAEGANDLMETTVLFLVKKC